MSEAATGRPVELRNRIKELRRVDSRDLLAHAGNWREHPQAQADALAGALREVGIADALIAYESPRNGGKLTLIDGHLRKDSQPGVWPVLVLDVDDAEADYLLATLDPLTGMATAAKDALDALLATVQSSEAAVQQMLADGAAAAGLYLDNADFAESMGNLPTGDKAPFQQMTFTLSDAQAERVKVALQAAKDAGPFVDTGNENSNGNALARICEAYSG